MFTQNIFKGNFTTAENGKNFRPPSISKFPVIYRKNSSISSTTNSDDFFSHFLYFVCFSPSKTLQVQLHNQPFCIVHSLNFTLFTILFYTFPLFLFQIYNYNCTIPILQLKTTFYNCTNCHQLHVKICPVFALILPKSIIV